MASDGISTERRCSLCSRVFLSMSSCSASPKEDGEVLCSFCRRAQLQEQLRQISVECDTAIKCPNPGCGIVIQTPELLNKHAMGCKFTQIKCAQRTCSFVGTKDELILHTKQCECYEMPCPHCGACWTIGEILGHEAQCRVISTCDECGMHVPNSCKITHDAWLCTARGMWSFCRFCEMVINHRDLQRHRDSCVDPGEFNSVTPESTQERVSRKTMPLPYDDSLPEIEIDEAHIHCSSPLKHSHNMNNVKSTSTDESVAPITHEQLLSSLSEPGNEVKPHMRTSDGGYRPPTNWSPAVRQKWEKLMKTVDENMDEYRERCAMSNNQMCDS